ncbi:MAG: HYR domain-containing protein [Marinifilaceae bacterium]
MTKHFYDIKIIMVFALLLYFCPEVRSQTHAITDPVFEDQHICVGESGVYTVFGFPGSTIKWYINNNHLTGKDVVVPNNAGNVRYNGFDYNSASLSHTWDATNYPSGNVYTLQIEEISASPAACPTGLVTPGLKVHVHAKPSVTSVQIDPIACNGQTGTITVNMVGSAPTDLDYQYQLETTSGGVEAAYQASNVFGGLSAGTYKVRVRYVDGTKEVKGSVAVSSDFQIIEPTALALSNSVTDVTCSGDSDGAIDLTVTGGETNSLNFNGTSGGVQINSWSPLYNASQFTVEGWVKLKSGNNYTSGQYSLFGQNNTVEFGIDGGNLHGWVHTRYGSNYSVDFPVAGNLDDGEFHHVAFSGNRNQLTLYVDGTEVESVSVSISASDYFGGDPGDYLHIGTGVFDGSTNDPFDGEISRVRFWTVARTQNQILTGMSQVMTGSESGLLGAYSLLEGSGNTISGVGNPGHDGTIASGVSWVVSAPIYQYNWTKQGDAGFTATTQDLTNLSTGTYQVTVTNSNGCTISNNNITVGVKPDITDPVISNMPSDILVTNCNQVVNWIEPTATDNCGTPTLNSNHNPGKVFPSGTTTVTYTASDGTNSVQESFTVTVQDDAQAPMICFEATNHALGKAVSQSSTYPGGDAFKAVDGNSNGVWDNHSVTHTNNNAQAWWQVDLGAEEVVNYVNVFRRTDCCWDRLVNFYVLLSKNDLQSVSLADALKDQSVESYYVAGNPGDVKRVLTSGNTARFVKIQLAGSNFLSLAEVEVMGCTKQNRSNINVVAEDGKCTAKVTWDAPTALDNCGTANLSSNYSSGADFPVGTTTVTYTATDGTNVATSSFDVIVSDDQEPLISNCPKDRTVGYCNRSVNWTAPTATDNCGTPTLSSNYNSGDIFPVGTTQVIYTADDGNGKTSTCSFNITVHPELTLSLSGQTAVDCFGGFSTITLTAGGGDGNYTYSKDGTNYQSVGSFNLAAGNHTLYVKDGKGCITQKDIAITQPTELSVTLTPSATTICEGEEVNFTINASGSHGNYVYMFYVNGNYVDGTGDYTLNAAKNVMSSTKFKNGDKISIQVESVSCQYDTPVGNEIEMTVNSRPIPVVNGSTDVCADDTEVYSTESGMSNYTWNVTGGTIVEAAPFTNTITVKWGVGASGTVSVNYENGKGCNAVSASSKTITIYARPNPSEIATDE